MGELFPCESRLHAGRSSITVVVACGALRMSNDARASANAVLYSFSEIGGTRFKSLRTRDCSPAVTGEARSSNSGIKGGAEPRRAMARSSSGSFVLIHVPCAPCSGGGLHATRNIPTVDPAMAIDLKSLRHE